MSAHSLPTPALTLTVRVPASTSNLGPGFDQLGLALDLPLTVQIEGPLDGPSSRSPGNPAQAQADRGDHELCLDGGFASDWPVRNNRMLEAFDAVWRACGPSDAALPRYRFRVHSEIPLCRGLGSSGAATAAGLVLGAETVAREPGSAARPTHVELERIGVRIEGHPDNVIASLHGGCTLGVVLEDGSLRVVKPAVHPTLLFPVAWPSTPLSTEVARKAMPSKLPLDDVVWNTRRFGLLLEGLRTGDRDLLRHGVDDKLHTPYRLPLIEGAREALQAAYDAGAFCAAISGSGSALVAAHADPTSAENIAASMRSVLAARHASAECTVLAVDTQGARFVD